MPDTTPPTVASVSPSGDVSTVVSSLAVAFDKAIDPSTFTSSEVTITGPNGVIPTGSITVTEVDAADYTVAFPQQTQEATYTVSIGGPGVHDISGNAMTAAYLTSFIIDLTAPSVVSVTPTGTVNTVVSTVDVTFSKPINASTLDAANITLTGPGGADRGRPGLPDQRHNLRHPVRDPAGRRRLPTDPRPGRPGRGRQRAHAAAPTRSTFTMALPDLTAGSVMPSVTSAHFGDTITVSWSVTQQRQRRRDRPVDRRRLPLDDTDARAPARSSSGHSPRRADRRSPRRASYNGQATVQLPDSASLPAGTYDLIVLVDAGGVVNESDTTTQTSSTTINLAVAPPPDLAASSVTSSLTAGQPGQSETVTWTVQNVGGSPADGPWTDGVYLSPDGKLGDATLLGSVTDSAGLAAGTSNSGTFTATLPASLADGTYQVIVVADSGDAVSADPDRVEQPGGRAQPLTFGHVDLVPTIVTAPTAATSGTTLTVKWTTTNEGTATTLAGWVDSAYLSTTGQVTSSSLLLGTVSISGPLAPRQTVTSTASATIPLGDTGTYQIIVVSDATNQLIEPSGTANTATQAIDMTIAPYADLAVSNVIAPAQTIGDPAYPTISWTVTNVGTGAGQTSVWTDAVIASPTDNVNDSKCGRARHLRPLGRPGGQPELHPDPEVRHAAWLQRALPPVRRDRLQRRGLRERAQGQQRRRGAQQLRRDADPLCRPRGLVDRRAAAGR